MNDKSCRGPRDDEDGSRSYMIVESFTRGNANAVHARFAEQGRMLPQGLEYVDSWLAADQTRCFQLMRTDRPELFERWFACWEDLVEFEVVELGEKPK